MFAKSLVMILPLLYSSATSALPSPPAKPIEARLLGLGTLFGPFTLPQVPLSNVALTLVNAQDEVFDVSSISIFGDINDGNNCTELSDSPATAANRQGQTVVFGPVNTSGMASITNISLTMINFQDEVFDVSSISVFGDINDDSRTVQALENEF
ncbi:hypothetical protein COCC4DRAFT_22306 [Bipolaris maydis ATCC 48331]|uniref:Uncharacterized protein n=2 Tax=Cochliobolus heterostrophus TaxID=5016 RepID=M2UHX5_COCH5|nr:uncharacterized protein COCC4DRAFT_22306 [Bipolaris maydis ATCC 48331]EMD87603.1 hypothetical protein COCHEDRAFT_1033995 [Bipolaris maydis C5]KAH7554966.1 hypothetical protein BM1_07627 [Bipolaris maydis]ENI06802.1 hypothetical protein COCC4DRAFT_22306 [Bipolaris maydis ATCC 48331]KAJ5023131.1 hypothetical protein J3E73DRAFT_373438 [Bipolaris maydis]KAJ5056119.1 hypothetical protein J3E74DRAFT_410819 [Bipolaris maydis]